MYKDSILKKIIKLLRLDKPLVIFDLETTGLSISSDKIIDLAYIKVWPKGRIKKDDIMLDPEMKLSLESISVHGIKDGDLKGKPKFPDKAQEIWDVFSNAYYSGFNIMNFDLPILRREFVRVGMDFDYSNKDIIDAREVFRKIVPRTLSTTYKYYTNKDPKRSHRAMNDVELSSEILIKQLEKYKEVRDWEFVNKIHEPGEGDYSENTRKFYWIKGETYFAFSKYKGKLLKDVAWKDPKFLEWIVSADFSEDTKNIVRKALAEEKKQSFIDKLKFKK